MMIYMIRDGFGSS